MNEMRIPFNSKFKLGNSTWELCSLRDWAKEYHVSYEMARDDCEGGLNSASEKKIWICEESECFGSSQLEILCHELLHAIDAEFGTSLVNETESHNKVLMEINCLCCGETLDIYENRMEIVNYGLLDVMIQPKDDKMGVWKEERIKDWLSIHKGCSNE